MSSIRKIGIIATSCQFQDENDNSKKIKFELADISPNNLRVLNVPNNDTTLVGTDTTQNLSNKVVISPTIENSLLLDECYIEFDDISEPSMPSTGKGKLYKKTGNSGLYWKSADTGIEIDLSASYSIKYYSVSATSTDSTTSSNYVVINSMSITPEAGLYFVTFSSSGYGSASTGNYDYAIFQNGVVNNDSIRHINYTGDILANSPRITLHSQLIVTVNGSETVDVRFKRTSGTFFVFERSLYLFKL